MRDNRISMFPSRRSNAESHEILTIFNFSKGVSKWPPILKRHCGVLKLFEERYRCDIFLMIKFYKYIRIIPFLDVIENDECIYKRVKYFLENFFGRGC